MVVPRMKFCTSFYLAGRFSRRHELGLYANELKLAGYQITSRWLHSTVSTNALRDPAALIRAAHQDLDDVKAADGLVLFTEAEGVYTSGGRLVEFGVALGAGKRLFVVGPPENIFENGRMTMIFPTWEALKAFLGPAGKASPLVGTEYS